MKRPGPVLQMQDVLLACGELNERERVAVQWVLDRANEEIGKRLTVEQAASIHREWLDEVDCLDDWNKDALADLEYRFTAATNQAANE